MEVNKSSANMVTCYPHVPIFVPLFEFLQESVLLELIIDMSYDNNF